MANVINTKLGTFNVSDNGKNGAIISIAGIKIAEFPKVSWWNVDSLENAIEQNAEVITQRIAERVNNTKAVEITKDNALQTLEKLIEVLGNEEKGFYSSRLKQCINKLKAA